MSEQLESIYPQLSDHCPKTQDCCPTTNVVNSGGGSKFAYFILWWIILVVIIWFIIYSLQPSWIMKDNDDRDCDGGSCKKKCEVDQGKAILVSVIIALIIMLLFYFASTRCGW